MTLDEARAHFLTKGGMFIKRKFEHDDSEYKKFILDNVKFSSIEELAYRLKNNDFEEKICKTCGKPIQFTVKKMRFRKYCSGHCMAINDEYKKARMVTMLSKYGMRKQS